MAKRKETKVLPEKLSKFVDFSKGYEWETEQERTAEIERLPLEPFSEETGMLLLNNLYKIFYVITIFTVALITRSIFINQELIAVGGLVSIESNWLIISIAIVIFIIPICIYFYYFIRMMNRVLR